MKVTGSSPGDAKRIRAAQQRGNRRATARSRLRRPRSHAFPARGWSSAPSAQRHPAGKGWRRRMFGRAADAFLGKYRREELLVHQLLIAISVSARICRHPYVRRDSSWISAITSPARRAGRNGC